MKRNWSIEKNHSKSFHFALICIFFFSGGNSWQCLMNNYWWLIYSLQSTLFSTWEVYYLLIKPTSSNRSSIMALKHIYSLKWGHKVHLISYQLWKINSHLKKHSKINESYWLKNQQNRRKIFQLYQNFAQKFFRERSAS